MSRCDLAEFDAAADVVVRLVLLEGTLLDRAVRGHATSPLNLGPGALGPEGVPLSPMC